MQTTRIFNFRIPQEILTEIVESNHNYGKLMPSIIGISANNYNINQI